jgi:hypothetical protein
MLANHLVADQRGWNAHGVVPPGGVRQHGLKVGFARPPIPDPVIAAPALAEVIVDAGDGVAEDLSAFRKMEGEAVEHNIPDVGLQRRLVGEAPPYHIAAVLRCNCWQKLLTDG